MANYVKNNSIGDDEDYEAGPEFAYEVEDEDLEWDLPDSGDAPELDAEEDAAWEAGELALLEESIPPADEDGFPEDDPLTDTDIIPDIEDDAPDDTDIIPDIEDDIPDDTDIIPDVEDALDDTDIIPDIEEYALDDTDSIPQASEDVPTDTDVIEIVDTEDIAGEDVLEISNDTEETAEDDAQVTGVQARQHTALDYAIRVAAVIAAALAVVAGLRFHQALEVQAEAAQYQTLGSNLAGAGTIGADQFEAIRQERIRQDEERVEAERKAAEKAELAANEGTIPVTMALSTVQSDLKIKIHGEDSSLISDVPFKVEVTLPSGKTAEYEDDDQDGIIYQTGLSKGTYKVTLEQLVADAGDGTDITDTEEYKRYSQYKIPTDTQSIAVTDKIAYKAIDVSDEIKSASQVNVAAEDTQQKLATESALVDTVEWVESTATAEEDALYEVVDKADIVDPNVSARTDLVIRNFRMLAQDSRDGDSESNEESDVKTTAENGNDESENGDTSTGGDDGDTIESKEKRSYTTTIKGSTSVAAGSTTLITASTDEPGATVYSWSLDGDAISIDRTDGKTVTVTGVSEGTATLTVTARLVAEDADPTENVVQTTITVTAAEERVEKRLTVSPTSVTLAQGKTQQLSAEVEGLDDHSVTYESGDSNIASVSSDGTITANAAGETTITVTASGDSSLKQSVKVKVAETETNNAGDTLLKDKDGNKIYVKDNGTYREATGTDYNTFDTFYRRIEGKAATAGFKYTGWQNIGGKTYYFNSAGEPVTGNQVINGAAYSFGSDGALQNGTSKVGIDVSQWNGSIAWSSVPSSGVSYAIIRCGYRGSATGALIRDPNFSTNIAGATAAGLKVGIYLFSQAVNEVEAVEEASMAISLASGYGVSLPIFIDVEAAGGRADGLSVSQRTAVVSAFCQTVQAAGYSAGVYSNTNWLTECINTPALTSYHIWVAQYASALSYTRTRYDIWQYSSKGRVNGISGDVDMNRMY